MSQKESLQDISKRKKTLYLHLYYTPNAHNSNSSNRCKHQETSSLGNKGAHFVLGCTWTFKPATPTKNIFFNRYFLKILSKSEVHLFHRIPLSRTEHLSAYNWMCWLNLKKIVAIYLSWKIILNEIKLGFHKGI